MERLKLFNILTELEKTKNELENLLNDVSDDYCNSVEIRATIDTNAFTEKRKYLGSPKIIVDRFSLIDYLKQEIKRTESNINLHLEKLKSEIK